MTILRIRKLADKSSGRRETLHNPRTGQSYLYNPDTPGTDPEPWPFVGVEFVDDPPTETMVPTRWVAKGVEEGWIERVGEQIDHQPGGPPGNPWAKTHTFIQAEQLIFKTVHGDVAYNVRGNPGKYDDLDSPSGTRVVRAPATEVRTVAVASATSSPSANTVHQRARSSARNRIHTALIRIPLSRP